MSWIQKIWPARSKSKQGLEGALVRSYGQDLRSPEELIDRANKRAVRGDLEGAIADFDAAIELNPARATTFYNRACLHNLSGNHQQAIVDCSEAIALLPDYDEAFYQRGIARLELERIKVATIDFTEVLRLNPFSIKAYYKRASCYAAQNDIQGAVADYTQAILRVPKDSNAYLQRGLFLTKIKEYATAVEDFSAALSFNPKSADAYYHRGCCYAELGQTELATQDFNQAMLYDPSQEVADSNRSFALGIIKKAKNLPPAPSDAAPAVIQEHEATVLSLNSDRLGLVEPLSGRVELASSLDAEPNDVSLVPQTDVDLWFADAQKFSEAGDFGAAVESYSKIIAAEPDNARAYWERGKSFVALGEVKSAERDLDAAVNCAKQKSLSLIQAYQGELSTTIDTLKIDEAPQVASNNFSSNNQSIEDAVMGQSRLIHQNPLDAAAYFNRARSRALMGDLDGAIADYTRTISIEPQHREAYYRRGMLLEALGDEDGATQDFNRAVRRPPLLLPSAPAPSTLTLVTPPASNDTATTPIAQEHAESAAVDDRSVDRSVDRSDYSAEAYQDLVPPTADVAEPTPTYFSSLVLDPCTCEGNDPASRFCIRCGQPLQGGIDNQRS